MSEENRARDEAHEERVQRHWRKAVTQWLTTRITRTTKRFLLFSYQEVDLPMTEETAATLLGFMTDHLDLPESVIRETVVGLQEEARLTDAREMLQYLGWVLACIFGILFAMAAYAQGADYAFNQTHPLFMMRIVLAGFALIIPAGSVFRAKPIARRRALRQYGNTPAVLEAYCDIEEAGVLRNLGRRRAAIAAALSLACVIGAVLAGLPTPLHQQVAERVTYPSRVPEASLDRILTADGQLTDGGRRALDRAIAGFEPGADEALALAAYAQLKAGAGYPEAAAREGLTRQIAAVDPTADHAASLVGDILARVPWTLEPFFEKYRAADSYTARRVLQEIAKAAQAGPLADRVERALRVTCPQTSPGAFLAAAMTSDDLGPAAGLLAEADDPARIAMYAEALADQPNRPEDIVPALYRLRERGLSLKAFFPGGVAIALDLTALNPPTEIPEGAGTPAGSRFLVISRTEKDEPAERLDTRPADGYDGHDKRDASLFTVRAETAALDRLPLSRLPASWEDCDWLAISDMVFVYGGCLEGKSPVRFYPVYGRLYRLLLVEREGLLPRRLAASKTVDAPLDQKVARWTNTAVGTSIVSWQRAPAAGRWAADQVKQFLDGLERAGWDIGHPDAAGEP